MSAHGTCQIATCVGDAPECPRADGTAVNAARLSVLWIALSAQGCSLHILAQPRHPGDERITKPELATLLQRGRTPKVVLRVPAPRSELAGEQAKVADEQSQAYNIIERELLRAGYTVRDRGLLGEILAKNPMADYSAIRQQIDTDLILEIVSLGRYDMTTHEYQEVENGEKGQLPQPLRITGWRMEARIILVESGEIGAVCTHYLEPADPYFVVASDDLANTADESGNAKSYTGWELNVEPAAVGFAKLLLADLSFNR